MTTPDRDDDVDARFNAIVAGLADNMRWDDSGAEPADPGPIGLDADAESALREHRRALRKAERAAEYAEFAAEKAVEDGAAEDEAVYDGPDAHFVPPDPPPLPRLRRRTVVAMIAIGVGLVLFAWPQLLQVDADLARIIGVAFLVLGFVLLISGLRQQPSDPDSPDWDNGARL